MRLFCMAVIYFGSCVPSTCGRLPRGGMYNGSILVGRRCSPFFSVRQRISYSVEDDDDDDDGSFPPEPRREFLWAPP